MDILMISALIAGLTQNFKMIGVDNKYLPSIAIVLGGLLGLTLGFHDIQSALFSFGTGALLGMATTGLVDRVDHIIKK